MIYCVARASTFVHCTNKGLFGIPAYSSLYLQHVDGFAVMQSFYSNVSLAPNWASPSNEKNSDGFLARSVIPLIFSSFLKNSSGCFTK